MNDICDMDESLKRNVEWKKFDTKMYKQVVSIYKYKTGEIYL